MTQLRWTTAMPSSFVTTPPATLGLLWRFVRGDTPPAEFERWVYGEPGLEEQLGGGLYLEPISTDFSNEQAVWALRCALAEHARARAATSCLCLRLKDLDVVDMGTFGPRPPAFERAREWSSDDILCSLASVAEAGPPRWWLWAARCRSCGQAWLVGTEERQNDVYCMKRLDEDQLQQIVQRGRWPPDFDTYEALLRIGIGAGRRVAFLDPLGSSMTVTVADLARSRPGISVSEIATLLGVEAALAHELAQLAVDRDQVQITFDRP